MKGSQLARMLRYIKDMPMIVAHVYINDPNGCVKVKDRGMQDLVDENLIPTPNWLNFNLEDYDQFLESLAAIEDIIAHNCAAQLRINKHALHSLGKEFANKKA